MNSCKKPLAQNGFTLIELLLYTVIIGSLLLGVVSFYGLAAAARVKNQSVNEVNLQGAAAIDIISQTLRSATAVTTPATAASGSTLTMTVPTASLSPTTFTLNGTTLQVSESTGAAVALTNDKVRVVAFSAKNLTRSGGHANVQVSLTLARVNAGNREEFNYQQTFTTSAELQW